MPANIIEIKGLGKKYVISHLNHRGVNYVALRDVISNKLSGLGKSMFSLSKQKVTEKKEEFWALKDISLNIEEGDIIGIIGRNGAGKTTLLKLLSRITEPTKGEVILKGKAASLLEVGTGFHPELTGRENIYLNGAILGMRRSEINEKFDDIVAFSETEKFLDTPVKRYSSGMYVRLAFSVAAFLESDILLVDEVLAVGDAGFQKKCLKRMEDASADNRTVLFVSHNMSAIKSLCNKVVLLTDGRIEKVGAPEEVINYYLNKETDSLLVREWNDDGPGNSSIKLRKIEIVLENANRDSVITVKTPIKIEFEFYNYTPDVELNLSMVLWTIAGECVLNSASQVKRVSKGLYKSTCCIPGDLLNDNIYSVEVLFIKDMSYAIFKQKDIITFEVHDAKRDKAWFGKWVGVVRPKLDFDIEKVKQIED